MKKGLGIFYKKGIVGFELGLLVLSLFSFSYFIFSLNFVEADIIASPYTYPKPSNINALTGEGSVASLAAKGKQVAVAKDGLFVSEKGTEILVAKDTPIKYIVNEKGIGKEVVQIGEETHVFESGTFSGKSKVATSDKLGSAQLGLEAGGFADALVSGLWWATVAYFAGMMLGDMLGFSEKNTKVLSTSLSAGFGSFRFLSTWDTITKSSFKWLGNPLVGLGIGAIVFISMYRKVDTEVVTFDCLAWQAPTGGNDCEACNDETLPCSEYRCKSLGQSCEIVPGKEGDVCVYVNPRDVEPPVIRPNEDDLTVGHSYKNVRTSPPGPGFEIVNLESSDGCLRAFTPLEFGIRVSEPAQCKIDFNSTRSFEEMKAWFGGSNFYSYEHIEKFSLPSVEAFKKGGLVLENGKDLTFYIRCMDKNGNENEAEYAVNLCVDPTPDNTAPKIEATSVVNGGCVAENQDNALVEFYTNEPSSCRWDFVDKDYDNMLNEMVCSNGVYQFNANRLFGCRANLSGISREDTKFYIRCGDQPSLVADGRGQVVGGRNYNRESFVFSLRGSTGLKMRNLRPNSTVFGAVSPMPVELYVETLFGCNEGQAVCEYSATGNAGDYIRFFDTNSEDGIHTQRLDLTAGTYEYFVRCVDEGGNLVEDSVVFTLDIDTSAPVIARIYEEDGMLKIVTVRDSECAYSFDNCDFSFVEGVEMPYGNSSVHVAEWNDKKTYYIKCRDEFRNEDADCSAVVRPTSGFL